ncbi:NmrA family NAD(P)-binding protein [Streptacidiphilus carbonis]|uniref:NmrA family NAD(P)-binding protein n=1 Tax=Streptacidiphilus carbonis TaxID=105422 RepID=UPI0005A96F9C|nr:NAD(P)H-binding protein [Streptacidiphilus carbonis]
MIVITAPTGSVGSGVVGNLLGGDEPVRVVVRDPARLAPQVREQAEVVVGSHSEADVVDRAFEGADSVFWLVPPNPRAPTLLDHYTGFSRAACDAFKNHGVERVVVVSALGRGFPGCAENAGLVSASLAMDDAIAATGVGHRSLTLPGFMDNVLRQLESIRSQGVFSFTVPGDLKLPSCAVRDIAAVAAGLLRDHSWSGSGSVPVLGPEDISMNGMAQTMSEVLGRPVRYRQTPVEVFRATLLEHGMSEAMVKGMVDMMVAKAAGLDTVEPRTPQGSSPTSFRQWCEEVLKPAYAA